MEQKINYDNELKNYRTSAIISYYKWCEKIETKLIN